MVVTMNVIMTKFTWSRVSTATDLSTISISAALVGLGGKRPSRDLQEKCCHDHAPLAQMLGRAAWRLVDCFARNLHEPR
jgi:hypothetical protein